MITIRVQQNNFDVGAEMALLGEACAEAGAIASFLGVVRSTTERPIAALTVEHYPGMTERSLLRLANDAVSRFALLGCTVIHRVGTLQPAEPIVLVLAAAQHRRAALDSVGFLIDWLKTDAPFWKKETLSNGESNWVEARQVDSAAAAAWNIADCEQRLGQERKLELSREKGPKSFCSSAALLLAQMLPIRVWQNLHER